jgi:threonine dehydrogenase-like Zn-dependent dehydrogenase
MSAPASDTQLDVSARAPITIGRTADDACIDTVGMEAGGNDPADLRSAEACTLHGDGRRSRAPTRHAGSSKGGTLSILEVCGIMDEFPLMPLMNKGVAVRTAQQHSRAYVPRLLDLAQRGELTPAALATHRFSLEDYTRGYHMFKHKDDGRPRAVFIP